MRNHSRLVLLAVFVFLCLVPTRATGKLVVRQQQPQQQQKVGDVVKSVLETLALFREKVDERPAAAKRIEKVLGEQVLLGSQPKRASFFIGISFALLFAFTNSSGDMTVGCSTISVAFFLAAISTFAVHFGKNEWFMLDLFGTAESIGTEISIERLHKTAYGRMGPFAVATSFLYSVTSFSCFSGNGLTECESKKAKWQFLVFPCIVGLVVGMMRSRATALKLALEAQKEKEEGAPAGPTLVDVSNEKMYKGVNGNSKNEAVDIETHVSSSTTKKQAIQVIPSLSLRTHMASFFEHNHFGTTALLFLVIVELQTILVCT